MNIKSINQDKSLNHWFYSPLNLALNRAKSTRQCAEYTDHVYLHAGVGRVIEGAKSGREWVQMFRSIVDAALSVANFFAALRSKRRLHLLEEIDQDVRLQVDQLIDDPRDCFDQQEELEGFAIYASDGHSQGASAHEDKRYGKKRAVNHIFSLNIRTHSMAHLAVTMPAEGKKKEHEIKALKRIGGHALRLGAPKGIKVIHAYDPAVVDYQYWYKWKQGHGVYIISLEKSNSALRTLGLRSWNKADSRNIGVIADELIGPSNGTSMRRVRYQDPVSSNVYAFLTTEMTLPPGLIAFIYKLRWNIEKVFDETKNKLEQKKAWGKHLTAKTQQALFITLSHNLMLLLETKLEVEEEIVDEKAIRKQSQRLTADSDKAHHAGRTPNSLVKNLHRTTQRSLQFIRWLRGGLMHGLSWSQAVQELRPLMLRYLT